MNPSNIVERVGPCSSTTLIDALMKQTGCTAVAARQRISRAVRDQGLRYLGSLLLPSGGRVYYAKDQRTEAGWHQRLYGVLDAVGSSYRHLLHHLLQNGGSLDARRAESLCGFSVRPRKGHLVWETAKENLLREGIIWVAEDAASGSRLRLPGSSTGDSHVSYARFRTEQALASTTREFLRRNGLVAFGQTKVRHNGEDPEFGGYAWDVTAPTYISPYASAGHGSGLIPGFWVVDCLAGRKIGHQDMAWFLEKISAIRAQGRPRPFTAMMVADGYEEAAFRTGRSAGAVLTTASQLLGEEAAKALRLLLETLSNPGAVAKVHPEHVTALGEQIQRLEGAMGNLRGDLFELIVGVALLAAMGGSISVKREIRLGVNALTDIDIEVMTGPRVVVVECKGTLSTKQIGVEQVRDWFRNSVTMIRAARSGAFDGKRETYAFWTSGGFHPEAVDFMKRHKASCKKYDVEWKDAADVRSYLRAQKLERMLPVLNRISTDKGKAATAHDVIDHKQAPLTPTTGQE